MEEGRRLQYTYVLDFNPIMTWLDAAVLAFLLLVAAGGYRQGLVRGLVRVLALVLITGFGLLLVLGIALPTLRDTVERVFVFVALLTLAMGGVAWWLLHTLPPRLHRRRWNKVLGIVPALLQGIIVAGLLLAVAERVVPAASMQALIRNGTLTGRLLAPFDLIERWLIAG